MSRLTSIAVVLSAVWLFCRIGGLSIAALIDIPSLVFIVGVVFGGVAFSFGPMVALRSLFPIGLKNHTHDTDQRKIYTNALRRSSHLSYGAAALGFLVGAIAILGEVTDPTKMGPGFAVALICPFYSVLLSVLLFDGTRATLEAN